LLLLLLVILVHPVLHLLVHVPKASAYLPRRAVNRNDEVENKLV